MSWVLALSGAGLGCVVPAMSVESGPRVTPAGMSSEPSLPPQQPSDEATRAQLQLALDQGQAVERAVRYLLDREAAAGAEVRAGQYQLALALMPQDPQRPSCEGHIPVHLAVVVRDGSDGRIVPELQVQLTLFDRQGQSIGGGSLPFLWHALVNHYGVDLELPDSGPFRARVTIAPFARDRHDRVNGDRYFEPTSAEMGSLKVDPRALAVVHIDDQRRLELAQAQGAQLERAAAEMMAAVAADGAVLRKGDYLVGYAVELAEGYYVMTDGGLEYATGVEESAEKNAHVEVLILDARTGRFLPALPVQVTLRRGDEQIGSFAEPFMWHPWIYHYGLNWRVPGSGKYALEIRFERPPWRVYGSGAPEFSEGQQVRFDDVDVEVGQK